MPAARVSKVMKRLGIAVSLAAIVAAVWYLATSHTTRAAAPSAESRATRAAAGSRIAPAAPRPIAHVTRLANADERKQLADRIASAHTARSSGGAAISAPKPPRLPDDIGDEPPLSKTQIRDAMREVIPIVQKCYEDALPTLKNPNLNITAHLVLTGDPDVGTLVDADQLADDQGQPLPAKLDDCFRSTFQLMALPPLAEGDKLEVHYPLRFASN